MKRFKGQRMTRKFPAGSDALPKIETQSAGQAIVTPALI